MKQALAVAILLFALTSCKKTDRIPSPTYSGKVIRKLIDCGSAYGTPFVIQVNINNQNDTVATATLPDQFKIVNSKISFKMRDLQNGDPYMFCITSIIAPKEVVIYDVSNN